MAKREKEALDAASWVVMGTAGLGPAQPGCGVLHGTTWTVTWTRWPGALAGLAQGDRLPSGRGASSAATHL